MKITSFVKAVSIVGIGAGGITSAVLFSDINKVATPYLRVMTKETYLNLKKTQPSDNLSINYGSLPSSDVSFIDLLQQKNLGNLNAFIITTGSQAYAQTNNILNGINKNYGFFNPYECDSSALILKLYDLFYNESSTNHDLVKDFNINFYSFIDIVNTKEVVEAANLLQYRRTQLGEKPSSNGTDIGNPPGISNVWKVDVPDELRKEERPVVKSAGGSGDSITFNYEPSANYYEFLPDNGYETKYKKVYFRNQEQVSFYNNTLDWANSYASSYLANVNFDKQGSLVAAKKVDGDWIFQSFGSSAKIEDFIKFYNPESQEENNNNEESTS